MIGVGSHQLARVARRQVVLPDVQAGVEQQRDIGAVVDDEVGAGFAAEARDALAPTSKTSRLQCALWRICRIDAPPSRKAARGRFQRNMRASSDSVSRIG